MDLFSLFGFERVAEITWSTTPPRWHDTISATKGQLGNSSLECVCEFVLGDEWNRTSIPAFAIFDERLSAGPWMYFSETTGEAARRLAKAIAELRWVEHSPSVKKAELAQVLNNVQGDAIAAYKVSEQLRNSFPYLRQLIQHETPNGGYVYLLHDQQGHHKIGRSLSVDKRVKQLRTQPPFDIEVVASAWVPNCKDEERFLHEQYREFRLKGEWFALPENSLNALREYMDRVHRESEDAIAAYHGFDVQDWKVNRQEYYQEWRAQRKYLSGTTTREGYDY